MQPPCVAPGADERLLDDVLGPLQIIACGLTYMSEQGNTEFPVKTFYQDDIGVRALEPTVELTTHGHIFTPSLSVTSATLATPVISNYLITSYEPPLGAPRISHQVRPHQRVLGEGKTMAERHIPWPVGTVLASPFSPDAAGVPS